MENYTHYNGDVNSSTEERLLDLNRRFYADRGRDFSETRQRLQPGVKRLLDTLHGHESVLDLGCGNGRMAHALARRGHHGSYLGLDSGAALLAEGAGATYAFPVQFLEADLVRLDSLNLTTADPLLTTGRFSLITSFAVLHHIPGGRLREGLLCWIRHLLAPNGSFMHSNWQFLESARMRARIQPWSMLGLTTDEVDPDDYLLDWRRGGNALRYVHQFNGRELAELARATGFDICETFYSDGADRKSALYQIWKKKSD